MQLTKRQIVLLDRIEKLLSRAADLPCPIVEAWGGGSLFRLDPSPKDADCVFRYENEHRLWTWFREVVEFGEEDIARVAHSRGLGSLPKSDQAVLNLWIEKFSWSDLRNHGPLSSIAFLPDRLTKRIIKSSYPGISIVELTKDTKPTGWRMTLTKFWQLGSSFDRSQLLASARELDDSDRGNLLQQLAEFRQANQLFREAIAEQDEDKYQRGARLTGDPGHDPIEDVTPLELDEPTQVIRRLVKDETVLAAALQAAAGVGTTDPALIAIETLTSQAKVNKWGQALVKDALLTEVHLALAKHNINQKYRWHEFNDFQLITGLHDRGCLLQREGETFWFFAQGIKGVVFNSSWGSVYEPYRQCVFLTTLDDDRPFFEWPVYFNSIPSIDELWGTVTSLRSGDKIQTETRLYLTCPFCERNNVDIDRLLDAEYSMKGCSHIVHGQLDSDGETTDSIGLLVNFAGNESLATVNSKHVKYRSNARDQWSVSGLFVKSPEHAPKELKPFGELDGLEDNADFQQACQKYVQRISNLK